MTAHRLAWLYCDPGEENPGVDCDEQSGEGNLMEVPTVAEAREYARARGWHVTRSPDGKVRDVCPMCWDQGRR